MRLIEAEFVRVIVESLKEYCIDNGIKPSEFDYDVGEFEVLTIADVMMAFIRAEGKGFDHAAFMRAINDRMQEPVETVEEEKG